MLRAALGLFTFAAASAVGVARSPTATQPDLVLIVADDLGWSDVGFQGAAHIPTPHLDRLAREGVVFSQFYATPTCTPSRAVLMTGQYGPRHGIYSVDAFGRTPENMKALLGVVSATHLPEESITLAESLRAVGYRTAIVGKWHLGKDARAQGFDVAIGGGDFGKPDRYFAPYGNVPLPDAPAGEYLTDRLTDEACALLAPARSTTVATQDAPLFLYYAAYAPHVPHHARESWLPPGDREVADDAAPVPPYYAMVAHFDFCIGRLMDGLAARRAQTGRDFVVLVCSDNGGQLISTSNRPLRGQKGTLLEGGVRVPAVLWAPGLVPAGRIEPTPVAVQDVFPTFAGFGGAPLPQDRPVDGVDLRPLVTTGHALGRDALFWHLANYNGAIDYNAHLWQTPAGAVRMGDWKLIENFEDHSVELYELASDPGESRNLATSEPARAGALRARLHAWRKETGAPVPTETNPAYDPATRALLPLANTRKPDEWRESVRYR